MSSSRVVRGASAVPSTSAMQITPKRALSDTEDEVESQTPQPKRARSVVADASTSSVNGKDKKKRRKSRKRKVPIVQPQASASSPNGRRLSLVGAAQPPIDGRSRSAPVDGPSTQTQETTREELPVSTPAPAVSQLSSTKTLSESDLAQVENKEAHSHTLRASMQESINDGPQPQPSPSSSVKGKNKAPMEPEHIDLTGPEATSSAPAASVVASVPDPTTQLLAKHTALLNTLTQSLTCQICLDGLHKPYALAPCGHVACRSCLVAWFSAPVPDNAGQDHRPLWRRKKTCPHCRAHVSAKPAELWVLKEIAAAVAKSGLAPEPFAAPPAAPAEEEARDPWEGIFYRPGAPEGEQEDRGQLAENRGVRDDEDAVWRCVDCFHEIWDGICSGCQRVYPGHQDEDEEDLDEEEQEAIAALYGGEGLHGRFWDEGLDNEDGGWGLAPGAWPRGPGPRALLGHANGGDHLVGLDFAPGIRRRPWWARGIRDDGRIELSDDEDDDEDHFDEDGIEWGPPEGHGPRWDAFDGGAWGEDDEDDEDDGEVDGSVDGEFGYMPPRIPPARARGIADYGEEDEDEDEEYEGSFIDDGEQDGPEVIEAGGDSDDEDPEGVVQDNGPDVVELDSDDDEPPRIRVRGRPVNNNRISDGEDDEDEDEVQILDLSPVARRRGARPHPIVVDSDDEEYAGAGYVNDHGHAANSDEEEEEGESDGLSDLTEDDEGEDEVAEDGSINRIPRHLAGVLGRGIRF